MLSRTADNLHWLARYVERADFLARIIKASQRLAALPANYSGTGTEWESALEFSGALQGLRATRGSAEEASVVDYLTFAPDNPSSIRNCIKVARANARAVRTALTAEMWEAINCAWIELGRFEASRPACMNSSLPSSRTTTAWGKQSTANIFCTEAFARVLSSEPDP